MKKLIICFALMCSSFGCGGKKTVEDQSRAQQKDPAYNYKLGVLYLNQGNVPSSILAFRRCIAFEPENIEAWNAMGLAHFMGKQYKEALQAFAKVLELNPSYTDVHNNIGNVYSDMGLLDKAKAEYNKVLEDLTYPKPEAAYFNLALVAVAEQNSDSALNYCKLALSMNPQFSRVYNLIGQIYEKKNDLNEAISNYRVGLQIDSEQLDLNYNLGVALFKTKSFDEARVHFEKVVRINPASMQGKQSLEYLQMLKRSS